MSLPPTGASFAPVNSHGNTASQRNRTATKAGGDSAGANLRSASYTRTLLNQYSSRTVPGAVDILGIAHGGSVVTVNSQTAYRTNEFYHKALSLDNSAAAVYSDVTVSASLAGSTTNRTGKVFIPRSAENFTYDPDGNLASDGRWTYTWDCENRLITLVGLISGVVPNRIDFEYDYLGRRIKKTVTNGSTVTTSKYLYRGGLLVGELNGSNGLLRSYMWGLDLSGSTDGAGGAGGLLAVKPAGGPAHFAGYDGNGNVTALVNGNDGSTSAQYEYGPFGELIRMSGAMAASNPIRFSSKFADDETDLIYYGFRYYNPSTGRWLCRDPIGEAGGMNLYGFVQNNPIGAVDSWGLESDLLQELDDLKTHERLRSANFVMGPEWDPVNLGFNPDAVIRETYQLTPLPESIANLEVAIAGERTYGNTQIDRERLNHVKQELPKVVIGATVAVGTTIVAPEGVLIRFLSPILKWARFLRPAAKGAGTGEKLFWGTWNDYTKVTQGGRSYAQVGDRLYTRHAVDRMQPSGLGAPAGAGSPGRSISPNFIEDVIRTGSQRTVTVDGVQRQIFTSGSVEVITEQAGRIVITVNPFKH